MTGGARTLRAAVAVAAILAMVTASAGAARAPNTGFERALGTVSAGPVSRRAVGWADFATMRRLHLIPASSASAPLAGVAGTAKTWWFDAGLTVPASGASTPADLRTSGLDVLASSQATGIGADAPAFAVDGHGFDAARLRTFLVGAGAKPLTAHGTSFLALGAEGSTPSSTYLSLFGSMFDRVHIAAGKLASGPSTEAVGELLGGGQSLLDLPAYAFAGSCLGDVVLAEAAPPSTFRLASTAAPLLAWGVRAPAGGAIGDGVFCTVFASAAQANADLAVVRRRMALSAIDSANHKPWSTWFSRSVVDLVSGPGGLDAVRVVLTSRTIADMGFVLQASQYFELGALSGIGSA